MMSDEVIEIPADVAYEWVKNLRANSDPFLPPFDGPLVDAIEATRPKTHTITVELTTEERDAWASVSTSPVFHPPGLYNNGRRKLVEACCKSLEADDE